MKQKTSYVLAGISTGHFINDMMQSVLLALYPVIQGSFSLSFLQIGLITVAFQFSASLLQPLIGHFTDKRPQVFSLPLSMAFTLVGLLLLSRAWSYEIILLAAILIGIGSAIFHPEASRIARMASATSGKHGLAQSIFQVGGTMGSALGPLLAALWIVPYGQSQVAWVGGVALVGMVLLLQVSRWYSHSLQTIQGKKSLEKVSTGLTDRQVKLGLTLLLILIFSKFIYVTSLHSYLIFYFIKQFDVSIQVAQYSLFMFLFGSAIGTLVGGALGDKFGRKRIIWFSILGAAPFTLALPFLGFYSSFATVFVIGLIISSAFPAIVVFGQELVPGKTGMISGLFFGLSFGMAGIGAAILGALADSHGIAWVYHVCAYLPLIGMVAYFLPNPATKMDTNIPSVDVCQKMNNEY